MSTKKGDQRNHCMEVDVLVIDGIEPPVRVDIEKVPDLHHEQAVVMQQVLDATHYARQIVNVGARVVGRDQMRLSETVAKTRRQVSAKEIVDGVDAVFSCDGRHLSRRIDSQYLKAFRLEELQGRPVVGSNVDH